MAYTNKVSAVAAVLLLAIVMAPRLAESEVSPKMDPKCSTDLFGKCFATATVRVAPTEECCNDLKTATATQVTCLCENYIANPAVVNTTGPYSAEITTKCGVSDKYSCKGTNKGEEKNEVEKIYYIQKKKNGAATNKIASNLFLVWFLVGSLLCFNSLQF